MMCADVSTGIVTPSFLSYRSPLVISKDNAKEVQSRWIQGRQMHDNKWEVEAHRNEIHESSLIV